MSEEAILRLRGVTHLYGSACVLRVSELDIFAGEIVCVLGPTGAGKSTLLRLLSDLEPPSSGEILVFGQREQCRTPQLAQLRRVTMVFQHPLLLTGSVRYNVEYGLRLRGQANSRHVGEMMLERLGLLSLASRSVHTLSGGQRQLAALARALVVEPMILLLDEPTANLDPASVALVESVIAGENQTRGMTVIWATHHLFQARRVAHRTGLILNGELVEMGPTKQFFESPIDPRTAAFVRGEMVY
ncbi:MAG: ABC transporter ATP-binding protein [Isosphaeraceae bacterium]